MLLEQRVRPAELVAARGEEDLRARERHERVAGSMPSDAQSVSEHVAADVVAERRGRVGARGGARWRWRGRARPRARRW